MTMLLLCNCRRLDSDRFKRQVKKGLVILSEVSERALERCSALRWVRQVQAARVPFSHSGHGNTAVEGILGQHALRSGVIANTSHCW